MERKQGKLRFFTTLTALISATPVYAVDPLSVGDEQLIQQQQRQQALEQQLTPDKPDIHLATPTLSGGKIAFPVEQPCFVIRQVDLTSPQNRLFTSMLGHLTKQAVNRCLGTQGIDLLMSYMQNRLIEKGYVTTRVLVPAQALDRGVLQLTLLPGYVRKVTFSPNSDDYLRLYSTFPAHARDLLNLRDIEQGLENLQRLPTVQAKTEIVPAEISGESDIVITRQQEKMWRLGFSLDDAGSRSTGGYQGGITLSLDNTLALSDLFYVSVMHDLQRSSEKSSRNYTLHYSLPLDYWTFSVTGSHYAYLQTVAGASQDYQYSGKSSNVNAQVSRMLYRNNSQKNTLSYGVTVRQSSSFINDTEVEVQHRQTSSWRLDLQHRHFIGATTLDVGVGWQRGVRWFGAQPAPEAFFGEATALANVLQLNAQLNVPFTLSTHHFQYNLHYLRQTSRSALTPPEQFAIGGRWTVRGFDGERTLNASRGWYVRNELSWLTPLPNQSLYLAADYGAVSGYDSENLLGKHLAGGAIGLKGRLSNADYHLFAGVPFSKPDGFKTDPVALGFSLSWNF